MKLRFESTVAAALEPVGPAEQRDHPEAAATAARDPEGLRGLPTISLTADRRRLLEAAASRSGGNPVWRSRKLTEARELLALSQIAPHRLRIATLDLREALRAELWLYGPVPRRADGTEELTIGESVRLGLTYRQESMLGPTPGFSFVEVLSPADVFHAQVAVEPQHFCLGNELPASIRVRNLVLMVYDALTMQAVQIDVLDPAGVLNPEAARWWQDNEHRIPLTREPFLPSPPRANPPSPQPAGGSASS